MIKQARSARDSVSSTGSPPIAREMTRLDVVHAQRSRSTDLLGEPGGLAEQAAGRSVIILPQPQQAQRVQRLGPDR